MTVIIPGHTYELRQLDGDGAEYLKFVMRTGEKYPGNAATQPGTTIQEALRACNDRLRYVYNQIPCEETAEAGALLRRAIVLLENRAARLHGREYPDPDEAVYGVCCPKCGHVGHVCDERNPNGPKT